MILSAASDVFVGTAGNQQTFVDVPHFAFNPLSTKLYLEDGRLQSASPTGADDGQAPGALVAFAGIASLSMGAGRRKGRVLVLALLLVALAVSGCAGPKAPAAQLLGSDEPQPTLESTSEERSDLVAAGHGAIEGLVIDTNGLPVGAANVAILGTDLSTRSSGKGLFGFANVSAGDYRIRFDAQGFLSLEDDVAVQIGHVTRLNVTLVRPGTGSGNLAAHSHDDWAGATRLQIIDADVTYRIDRPGGFMCGGPGLNLYDAQCDTPIPFPTDARVLPGATSIEIVLTWSASLGTKEFSMRVETAGNNTPHQDLVPRRSGDPFRLAFFPNEADPGHQRFTSWKLFLRPVFPHSHYAPFGPVPDSSFTVHASVHITKGVVPLEPPHRSFWNGAAELVLFNEVQKTPTCIPCDYPRAGADTNWRLGDGSLVPPGSKEIKGYLRWTNNNNAPAGSDWVLVYRAANMGDTEWKKATMSGSGQNRSFAIPVSPQEADQFYQRQSFWAFTIDDQVPMTPGISYSANTGYGSRWWMSATVLRDPAYVEETPKTS
jgi:hypothetical protein